MKFSTGLVVVVVVAMVSGCGVVRSEPMAASPVAEALRVRLAGLREKALYGQVYVEEAVRAMAPAKTNVVIRPVDARTGVVFAIEMAGGCVTGFHDERDSEVEVGGYIADGGCLTAPGH